MSPFGGNASDPIWRTLKTRQFIADGADHSTLQAAFAVAYSLPDVGKVTVGTSNPRHLQDLVNARTLIVDEKAICQYRQLLKARTGAGPSQQARPVTGQALSGGRDRSKELPQPGERAR